jgi:hypothetical protein
MCEALQASQDGGTMIDGCGVDVHPAECLCDVHLSEILPVIGRVDEGWMFRQVAERLNVGVPWDNASILDVLSHVTELYDMYRATNNYPEVSDISVRGVNENPFAYYARVKETISEIAAQQSGVPDLNKILEHVGLTIDEFMTAVTYNRYTSGTFNSERIQNMIQDVQTSSVRKVCREYG